MAEITTDVLISCADENRRGGIKGVYVINKDDIVSFTASATNQSYTAVTLSTTNDVFYEIEGELETKVYSSEGSRENGSISYETSLEVFTPKMEKVKAFGINEYVESCGLVIIFETYNKATTENIAFVLGYDEIMGTDASVNAVTNEVLEGELQGQNGYTVTFAGKQAQLLREFVGTITLNGGTTKSFGA
tara:strand:- start:2993 stop:3562 length:570 start_codon:yes stop_codon:yes gene_type:complete